MPALRALAITAVAVCFAGQAPLAAQNFSQDSIAGLTKRYAPQVDSVRRANASAVLLIVLEHDRKVVRATAFPMRELELGNFGSVRNCFPDVKHDDITSTTVARAAGGPGPLRPDLTYLLYAKLKRLPTGGPLPPNADCGRR